MLYEVITVATFYNLLLRQPAGRRQIFVCDSISCELTGAAKLMEHLTEVLGIEPGQVTADGEPRPLCIALTNPEGEIVVDAALFDESEVRNNFV